MKAELVNIVNGFLGGIQKLVSSPKTLLVTGLLAMIVLDLVGVDNSSTENVIKLTKGISTEIVRGGYQLLALAAIVLAFKK